MEDKGFALDEIFNGASMTEDVKAVEETVPTDEVVAAPTGEEKAAPPVAEDEIKPNEHGMVPLTALEKERHRRQESEGLAKEHKARLAEYEAKIAEYEAKLKTPIAKPAAEPEKEISFYDDPEGYLKRQLEKERAEREAFQASVRNQAIIQQYEAMKADPKTAADFEILINEFQAEAAKNPALANSVARSVNPVAEAYRMAKNMREARLYGGDQEKLVAARVAEAVAAKEAEYKTLLENARLSALPKSNVTKRSDKGGAQKTNAPDESPFKKDY